jgi:hypothetical protein
MDVTVDTVAAAVEQVESRGEWYAERGCHRGVMQVCTRWSKKPAAQLWIPDINRQEGRRLLTYWHGKAHGDWWAAVAAYRCGWAGLAGNCGKGYASTVLRIARRLDGKGTLDLQVMRPQT